MKMELPGQSVPRPRISDPHMSPPRRLTLTLKCSKWGLCQEDTLCPSSVHHCWETHAALQERRQDLCKELCSQPTATNLGREGGRRTGVQAATIHCSSGSKNSEKLMHFSVLTTLVQQVMNYRSFCSYDTFSNCVSSN